MKSNPKAPFEQTFARWIMFVFFSHSTIHSTNNSIQNETNEMNSSQNKTIKSKTQTWKCLFVSSASIKLHCSFLSSFSFVNQISIVFWLIPCSFTRVYLTTRIEQQLLQNDSDVDASKHHRSNSVRTGQSKIDSSSFLLLLLELRITNEFSKKICSKINSNLK